MAGKVSLVTGGTRGVGREISARLAREGSNVLMGFAGNIDASEAAEKHVSARACTPEDQTIKLGLADLTSPLERDQLINVKLAKMAETATVAHVVLAASGGLESHMAGSPDYPHKINVEAQVELIRLLSEAQLLDEHTTITFLTSHQAWYLGQTRVLPNGESAPIAPWDSLDERYKVVAETKNEGVQQVTELAENELDCRLLVSSADIIVDSSVIAFAAMRFMRAYRKEMGVKLTREEALEHIVINRKAQLSSLGLDTTLLTSHEFAKKTMDVAMNPNWTGVRGLWLPDHLKDEYPEAP